MKYCQYYVHSDPSKTHTDTQNIDRHRHTLTDTYTHTYTYTHIHTRAHTHTQSQTNKIRQILQTDLFDHFKSSNRFLIVKAIITETPEYNKISIIEN